MASKLKTTVRTIERNMNLLREKGLIERVGSDKIGYWRIRSNQ